MIKTLTEILATPHYCVRPGVFEGLRDSILHNIDARVASGVEKEEHLQAFAVFQHGELTTCPQNLLDFKTQEEISSDEVLQSRLMDPSKSNGRVDADDDTLLVNIIRLSGPMTRNGDDCSFGSKDHRDLLMSYANNSRVAAHIIYTSTPGGMASTIRDYRKAINYCHARGQKVYMFCDGDVASGGAFLACLCDEVWANNPEDEIGSLGMYCAFFTLANGAENKITSEVYRELYADASTDKNGWYRQAAEGDLSAIRADLNADLAQMLADAKKDRPSVKEEQLTGKMYKMGSVKGSLVDRFGGLGELCDYAVREFDKRQGAALPAKEQADAPMPLKKSKPSNNNSTMKTYSNIAAMIGEEAYESQADGYLSLNEQQADALEARAGECAMMQRGYQAVSAELDTAKKMVEQLTHDLEETRAQLAAAQQPSEDAEALEAANATLTETQQQLDAMTAERDQLKADLQQKENDFEATEAELSAANEALAAKETELATANQSVADLSQKLETLNAAPADAPQAGEAPANNGAQVNQPRMAVNAYKWNPAISAAENLKLKRAHDQRLESLALSSQR